MFPKIEEMIVPVLGRNWKIRSVSTAEFAFKNDPNCGGYADQSEAEIIVRELTDDECVDIGNTDHYIRHILRHEIIHAFLFESGLDGSSMPSESWAINEEMVDWFASQHEKIHEAFRVAGALDHSSVVRSNQ